MFTYLCNKYKVSGRFLFIFTGAITATAFAEEKLPAKLEFEKIGRQEVSALLNNHSVPKIITLSWNKANEKFLSKPPKGKIAKYDLNNDGIDEVFLYTFGSGMCGSGGCHLVVFEFNKATKQLEYKTVRSGSDDILILSSLTDGYQNMAIRLMDGKSMSKAKEYTVFQWEGGDLTQTGEKMLFQQMEDNCEQNSSRLF